MTHSKTQQIYSPSSQPKTCHLAHKVMLCSSKLETLLTHVLSKLAPTLMRAFTMADKGTKNSLD